MNTIDYPQYSVQLNLSLLSVPLFLSLILSHLSHKFKATYLHLDPIVSEVGQALLSKCLNYILTPFKNESYGV